MNVLFFKLIFILNNLYYCYAVSYLDAEFPKDCLNSDKDDPKEFYDISQLKCSKCSQKSDIQTVSLDGLRCICRSGYKITRDFGGREITCEKCPINQEATSDGWQCAECKQNVDGKCGLCDKENNIISVEREYNGEYLNDEKSKRCIKCVDDTIASDHGTRCLRCNQVLSVISNGTNCDCPPKQMTGGLCFKSPDDIIADSLALYQVKFKKNEFESAYLFQHIRAAEAMCRTAYGNLTACQLLGNMCALNLYRLAKNRDRNACDLYQTFTTLGRRSTECGSSIPTFQCRPEGMPWLYYEDETADKILTDVNVREEFTFPNQKIKLIAFTYSLNGSFLGKVELSGSSLQLCKGSEQLLDASLNFGTTYRKECEISVRNFWDEEKYNMIFYDIFIQFDHLEKNRFYPIPILFTQYKNGADSAVNVEADRSLWKLTRRLFFVDNISGKEVVRNTDDNGVTTTEMSTKARSVRYLSKLILHVNLRKDSKQGQIYPPYLEVTYDSATLQDYEDDKKVKVSMSARYAMDLTSYKGSMRTALAVLSTLAIVNSLLQTWSWNKKASKIAMDFATITKFLVYFCSNLANVFFVVNIGVGLHWLIMFKKQSSVYLLLPNADQETTFITNIIVAFCLKSLAILNLIFEQSTINIFLVDWERSKAVPTNKPQQQQQHRQKTVTSKGDINSQGNIDDFSESLNLSSDVSIWRTCFVANEWNEIQTVRKVNPIIQIFVFIFFMNVVGFENITTRDPYTNFKHTDDYRSEDSRILRFAIAAILYLGIAVVQWFLYTLIYQRFIEDVVRQFVDLCSVNNISLFILDSTLHGYYIHGRSVHGYADTNMREMIENLQREEEDLCGQRGLLPGTEQQTFEIFISREMRTRYDRIMSPITMPQHGASSHNAMAVGQNVGEISNDKLILAYTQLNNYLQNYLDHAITGVDYSVQDRMFFGNLLQIEFRETLERGLFINDNGHSFDQVLFFGHENILVPFEAMMFCLLDLLFANFLLSALLTLFFITLLAIFRNGLSENNLANKTLIDRRFLI